MTLTRRLTLFLLATLAAVLAAFSAALYLLADAHLHGRVADRLDAAVRTLASAAEVDPDGVEWEPGRRPVALGPGGGDVRWAVTAGDGRVVDRSDHPDAEGLLAEADRVTRSARRVPRTLEYAGAEWRVTRHRFGPDAPIPAARLDPAKHGVLVLVVAAPLEPVEAALRRLAAALAGLTAVVLGVAAAAARAVCRRALAPVARMAAAARAMGGDDPAGRLSAGPAADELADLAAAFNGLLDRLGEAFARERRFTGEASHQLRTPVAAMIGQVEVALRRDRDPAEYRRILGLVLDQAGRLRRVVDALLFLARAHGAGPPVEVDPVELAGWVRDRLGAWAAHPRAADVRFEAVPGEAVRAAVHHDLWGEAVAALVDNALKYSEPGTPVVVRAGRDGAAAWVEVEDRGVGIPGGELGQVFQPFFRSAAARRRGVPGVGLGLAVAARIAAAHGGTIRVRSVPGEGSTFRAELPALPAGETG